MFKSVISIIPFPLKLLNFKLPRSFVDAYGVLLMVTPHVLMVNVGNFSFGPSLPSYKPLPNNQILLLSAESLSCNVLLVDPSMNLIKSY